MDSQLLKILAEFLALVLVLVISHFLQRKNIRKSAHDVRMFTDSSVRNLNGTVTALIHSWPGAAWLKLAFHEDGKIIFRMQELNHEYEESYNIDRLDYIGKTDLEAGWTHKEAEEFRQHDLMVWASGEREFYTEEKSSRHSIAGKGMYLKIRVSSPDGKHKGILGLEFDPKNFCPDALNNLNCPHNKETQR